LQAFSISIDACLQAFSITIISIKSPDCKLSAAPSKRLIACLQHLHRRLFASFQQIQHHLHQTA
jgi:hypothetical protein